MKFIKENILAFINILISIILLVILIAKSNNHNSHLSEKDLIELANNLKSKGLYSQAIDAYKEFLQNSSINKKKEANINYMIAELYREYLKDFENALYYYYKSKLIYPDTPLLNNINQKIVECLENSGHSREAQLALEESTLLTGKNKIKKGDIIVAKIDKDIITLNEFNKWFDNLPADIRKNYNTPAKKKEILRQFIAQELMYRKALRKGYQNNPDVLKKSFEIKKNLMIQKLMSDELFNKIKITQSDVELYYKANKDKYKQPLNQIYQQVYNDLLQERIQEESQKMLGDMIRANQVQIFDGNVK